MAEYIERNAAIDALRRRLGPNTSPAQKNMLQLAAIDIRGIKAADVAPVIHGRWENGCVCSNCTTHCGPKNKTAVAYYRYCPYCGAKMDGEPR